MIRSRIVFALAALTTLAAGAAEGPADLLPGVYSNRAQMASLADGIGREPARSGDWVDLQSAGFHRLAETPLDGEVIYLQWHNADGSIARQRLWVFRPRDAESVAMDFYAFRDAESWADLQLAPARQAALRLEDLVSYPPGCTVIFRRIPGGWAGALEPATCKIVTQRTQREMSLEAWIVITDEGLWYRERGALPDGETVFQVPGTGHYAFRPVLP